MDPRLRPLLAAAADVALVCVFVSIGRASHREDQSEFVWTLWAFLVGLAVGWLAARAWRRPFSLLRAGVPAWAATVVVGMLLRAASGQGVQVAFVVVASIVVGAFLLGWRFLLIALDRSANRTQPGPLGYFLQQQRRRRG